MIWTKAFVALMLLCLPAHARVGLVGGPSIVQMSTRGVIADGTTDNTAALNALPAQDRTLFHCDTGSSSTIKATGQIILQSNLHFDFNIGAAKCPLLLTWDDPNQNNTVFTQADLTNPITSVSILGGTLDFQSNLHTARVWRLWIDNFTWTDTALTNYNQIGIFRGSNVEIARLVGTNGQQTTGNPGFRWLRNSPQVTSTHKPTVDGVVANVWIHDNNIVCGDGCYQISPGQTTQLWGDTPSDSDGIVFQNNVCNTTSGPCILVGDGAAAGTFSGTIQNWVFDGHTGTCGNSCVTLSASADGGITTTLGLVKNFSLDDAADTNASPSVFLRQAKLTFITLDTCTIVNSLKETLRIDSNAANITVQNCNLGAPKTGSTFTACLGATSACLASGTVLTVTAVATGQINNGDTITGPSVAGGETVLSGGPCTSGSVPCTLIVSIAGTIASEAMQVIATPTLLVRDAQNVTVTGNTVAGGLADAILLGPTGHFVQTAVVNTNTITGITNTNFGINIANADTVTGTGNIITAAGGSTTAKGIGFTASILANPGTTNTQMNSNDPSAVSGTKVVFTCNGGITNQAISNTGATDHNCP